MIKQTTTQPQFVDSVWDDATDDLVVEILAMTIKRYKKKEKQALRSSSCVSSV